MLVKRIASLLMLAGVALWVLGFCAWLSGVWITLSPAAAKVFVLGFAVICGAVLLAAGAIVGRAYRRESVDGRDVRGDAQTRGRIVS
jgi:hypothetical protein